MSIIIGADIVPVKANQKAFENGLMKELIGQELMDELRKADYRIFNLETPLSDQETPIPKMGPCLRASEESIKGLKAIEVDLLTLANNHIMDQGVQGFRNTIAALEKAGIATVGAGENLAQARKAHYVEIRSRKIGIYGCAEHEFSIAEENYPGANPFDPLESPDDIEQMKKQCDYVIVLYHGGKEHYRYPSPGLRKICRKIVEKGADLVVCQHSHCIGCGEEYLQGTIVYGQGNFLFAGEDNEYWHTGMLLAVEEDRTIRYIPVIRQGNGVRKANETETQEILRGFSERSEEIRSDVFVEEQYRQFAKEFRNEYITWFMGKTQGIGFRILNKLSGGRTGRRTVDKYMKTYGIGARNYIECEAHRELFLKGLAESKKQ